MWTAALVLAGFVPAALFALVYGFFFPWWKNPVGWSLFNFSLVVALAMSLSAWRYFFGPPPVAFRLSVYAWIVVALWWQLGVLVLSPRMNRRRRRQTAR